MATPARIVFARGDTPVTVGEGMRRLLRAAVAPAIAAGVLSCPAISAAQNIEITAPAPVRGPVPAPMDANTDSNNVPDGVTDGLVDDATLIKALSADANTIGTDTSAKSLRASNPALKPKAASWSRDKNGDGSGAIHVTKSLAASWDAKVGGDLAVAATALPHYYEPGKPLPTAMKDTRTGSAWASLEVPRIATVELRISPSDTQNSFGTKIERTVPVGENLSVTLQNSVSVTDLRGSVATGRTMVASAGNPAEAWDTKHAVKVNIVPTGTTLSAGTSSSTLDPQTHNSISAEQKIYGPLQVTTTLTDLGQSTSSKSVTAGFKFSW
jgi:hypothetical protein